MSLFRKKIYIANSGVTRALVFLGLAVILGPINAIAAPLTYSSSTTVSLTSPAINFTIIASSTADTLVVNATSVVVTLSSSTGGSFSLTSASRDLSIATSSSGGTISQSCVSGVASTTISQSTGSTNYTITPTASACVVITITTPAPPSSGGGGGGISYSAPSAPAGGFSVAINGGASATNNPVVTLTLSGGSDAVKMAVSEDPNFVGVSQIPYASSMSYTLSAGKGQKTVYVKFYNAPGLSSPTVSATITLSSGAIANNSVTQQFPQVAPTAIVVFLRNLSLGSRGKEVKSLQLFLISANSGLAARKLAKVGANGKFGPLTRRALIEFQKNVGIHPANGNFGPKTRAYINSLVR